MAGTKRKFVGLASVGDAPKVVLDRIETMRFVFYNFKDLEQKRDEEVKTPSLEAFGYLWKLLLCPRGDELSSTDTEYISCYLVYAGDAKYKPCVKYSFRYKDYSYRPSNMNVFDLSKGDTMWGTHNYLKREDVLAEYLEDDGSLVIEVDLQITVDSKRIWYPKQLEQEQSWVEIYSDSADTSDITFIVGGMEFPTHTIILSRRAKTLHQLYKEYAAKKENTNDGQLRVPISNMKGETFQKILEFIYTVNTTPVLDDEASAIELLLAANRFDCTQLKLYVESVIVDKFLTTNNTASLFILGDTFNCALLKEVAMNRYASDPSTVKESDVDEWAQIEESNRLLKELLEYISSKLESSKHGEVESTVTNGTTVVPIIDKLDVTTLREQLEEAKLGLDGSREILVDRLQKYQHQQQQKKK